MITLSHFVVQKINKEQTLHQLHNSLKGFFS